MSTNSLWLLRLVFQRLSCCCRTNTRELVQLFPVKQSSMSKYYHCKFRRYFFLHRIKRHISRVSRYSRDVVEPICLVTNYANEEKVVVKKFLTSKKTKKICIQFFFIFFLLPLLRLLFTFIYFFSVKIN